MNDNTNEEVKIPTMLSLREAAKRTGLSYDYLRKACNRYEIVHVRCGNKILINLEKLIEHLNEGCSANMEGSSCQ